MLDRDEDMCSSGGRHPFLARYKVCFLVLLLHVVCLLVCRACLLVRCGVESEVAFLCASQCVVRASLCLSVPLCASLCFSVPVCACVSLTTLSQHCATGRLQERRQADCAEDRHVQQRRKLAGLVCVCDGARAFPHGQCLFHPQHPRHRPCM